jgi:hypothetical protein
VLEMRICPFFQTAKLRLFFSSLPSLLRFETPVGDEAVMTRGLVVRGLRTRNGKREDRRGEDGRFGEGFVFFSRSSRGVGGVARRRKREAVESLVG